MNDSHPSEVIFLLGAGASAGAGVPDTFRFVEDFRSSVGEDDAKSILDTVLDTLRRWKKKTSQSPGIDIELLMEALMKLEARDEEPLLEFIKGGRFVLKDFPHGSFVIERLKDFIKSKAIIKSQERIEYLKPLRGFIEERRPLDIISVNYDTCIEQFCSIHNLNYQDGFDVTWNPDVFEKSNVDVRLFKLHGSVIWYRSDRGGYIKLPVMTDHSRIELITGEKADSLMLYPTQKYEYAEPLVELTVRAKNIIQSKNCKFLVVVGYSFRDEHIMRMLLDVAARNSELTVILIDPNACGIYENRLQYFDSANRIPSSLANRVVCLPYRFEKVFPRLKDEYLRTLRLGLSMVSDCASRELRGQEANWFGCLEHLANAEHISKLSWLLDSKIDRNELEKRWQLCVELLLKMSMNMAANKQEEGADRFLKDLKTYLRRVMSSGAQAQIAKAQDSVMINFVLDMPSVDSGIRLEHIGDLKPFMLKQQQYLASRLNMAGDSSFVHKFFFIDNVIDYLSCFEGGRMTFEQYVAMRKNFIKNPTALRASMLAWLKRDAAELINPFAEQIIAIERQAIARLFVKNGDRSCSEAAQHRPAPLFSTEPVQQEKPAVDCAQRRHPPYSGGPGLSN